MPARQQRTLKSAAEFRGVGLHSGKEVQLVVKPAEPGNGISFVRTDLEGRPEIRVRPEHLKSRERRSCLNDNGAEIHTVEHLLASLWALGIDNAEVETNGEEVPGMDGSAQDFVAGLRAAGIAEQKAPKAVYAVKRPIHVQEGQASLIAIPGGGALSVDYHLDYPVGRNGSAVTRQTVAFRLSDETFEKEIALARTFVFENEVEGLVAAGLGKGANTQNTLVVGPAGVKENTLRCDDELARHKVLDLVGDLSILGVDLDAHLIATRSGHALNMKLVHRLREEMQREEELGDIQRESGLEIRQILNLLPHRYPFLMIDRVIELEGYKRAVAIKNVTINEPYFQGHWPGQPIMPGVLQLEAMAQLAGVLLLRKLENTGKLAVLWSIDKVKLRGAVVPGDQLRIEVETIRAKPSLGQVEARCKVGGKLVAEAELKFTLIDA
ncbi:MAG: UDP-3-O-[3-hydroxymyristoyl] N-acetylglucosamine deacetylase [Planctomycetes bacterium]|nr:UDP-3-O-[3-hydroxymyristoyl] N-acetylglucosamine deacetylase [Planctomycetota bacterium]